MYLPNNLTHKLLIPTFVAGLLLVSSPSPVLAEFKIVVSPPTSELTVTQGEVAQKIIKVTNQDSQPITLSATISDFIVQDNEGTPVKVTSESSGRYFAKPWITLSQDKIELEPQETKEIIAVFDIPQDALAGGHYAGVFFSPQTLAKPDTTGAAINPEIGSLFALNIPGNIDYNALITSFQTSAPLFEFGPVEFTATIENQSTTHITTSPVIEIKDIFGRLVGKVELDKLNIFPFTSRLFTGSWDQVFGFGRYSATLTVPYGTSHATTRLIYFYIIPYRIVFAVAVLILVIVALVVLINRRRKHTLDTRDAELDSLKRRIIELENKR